MASNVQAGTRGLSASDWIRMKRLKGSREFQNDKNGDITNSVLRVEPESGRRVYAEFGTSKIRRPASFWTDYHASRTSDFVLERQDSETKSRALTSTRCVCRLTTSVVDIFSFIIQVADITNLAVGDAITFTNITTEGTIIKNNLVVYVHSFYDVGAKQIVITLTPGGDIFDISTQDPTTVLTGATVTILASKPVSVNAIKHEPICVKCIHS